MAFVATSEACVSLDQYECWYFTPGHPYGSFPFKGFSQSSHGCSGTMEVPNICGSNASAQCLRDTSNWKVGAHGYTVDDRGITRSDGLTGTFDSIPGAGGLGRDIFLIRWSDGAEHTEDWSRSCLRAHPGITKPTFDDELAWPENAKPAIATCSGSCCDSYCQCPGYESHYCGSNGCDCGVCPGPLCIGCQYPYEPVVCDVANFTISV